MKAVVTISRKYGNPHIETTVWRKGEDKAGKYVEIATDLTTFIAAVKKALDADAVKETFKNNDRLINGIKAGLKGSIGSVALVFTKEEIGKRIDKAVDDLQLKEELGSAFDGIGIGWRIDAAVSAVLAAMREEWLKHPD